MKNSKKQKNEFNLVGLAILLKTNPKKKNFTLRREHLECLLSQCTKDVMFIHNFKTWLEQYPSIENLGYSENCLEGLIKKWGEEK